MNESDTAAAPAEGTDQPNGQHAECLDETVEAFRVGQAIGEHNIDPETLEALQRIQAKLDEAERGDNVKRAYANGYVDALSSLHAWTVQRKPRRKTGATATTLSSSPSDLMTHAQIRAVMDAASAPGRLRRGGRA